jgi:predicted DNA-binding transcriptional regulator AlpA
MPLTIDGVEYWSAGEVIESLGVSRATLWRWRHERKVPSGHRLRGRQVIFTRSEVDAIREFALRVEPIVGEPIQQLALFQSPRPARI